MLIHAGNTYLAKNGQYVTVSLRDGAWWRGSSEHVSCLFWSNDGQCQVDRSFDILVSRKRVKDLAFRVQSIAQSASIRFDMALLVEVVVEVAFGDNHLDIPAIRDAILAEMQKQHP